ncbi:Aprataxin, partial [Manis pentadactyla]
VYKDEQVVVIKDKYPKAVTTGLSYHGPPFQSEGCDQGTPGASQTHAHCREKMIADFAGSSKLRSIELPRHSRREVSLVGSAGASSSV